ncbi:hypothetical protein HZB00_04215 [Candidatus Woesearchaeota archaeon]|nr:hypothetical protein [Candidatus Woesearchaeota archaeon]
MAKATLMEKVGGWSFLIGLIIAIVLGLMGRTSVGSIWLLLALGLVVGLLNISDREIVPFLVACIALVVSSAGLASLPAEVLGTLGWLSRILSNIVIFASGSAIVASFKAIAALASSR